MAGINLRKRGGKAHFYRMGFLHGSRGMRWVTSSRSWGEWPDWARSAYSLGMFDGQTYQKAQIIASAGRLRITTTPRRIDGRGLNDLYDNQRTTL